jgi:hypothetical protein
VQEVVESQQSAGCADARLGEDTVVEFRRCIATNLSCADVCSATGPVLSRPWGYDAALMDVVLEACQLAAGMRRRVRAPCEQA